MQIITDSGTKRRSSMALFMDGFFSVMSYPFIFDYPRIERTEAEKRKLEEDCMDISRHFKAVGERLSKAYRTESERIGLRHE